MNRQEFEDTARRYREELFRMYAGQNMNPPPKPEPKQPEPEQPVLQAAAEEPPETGSAGVNPDGLPVFPMPEAGADETERTDDADGSPALPKRAYTGTIRVHVTTAMGTRPVTGASVLILRRYADRDPALISVQTTNESGEITPVTVPAPPPSADQRRPAYYVYDLDVQAAGYYRERSADVPVFPGVTSVQNFNMIPLPAGTEEPVPGDGITFYNNMQEY